MAALAPTSAAAHGFAQPYALPVPLWLYLLGAGATVALSFLVIALFVRAGQGLPRYPRLDLIGGLPPPGWAAVRLGAGVVEVLSVLVFLLIVVAGLFGADDPIHNVAPTLVWVLWWVGLAYVTALVGDVWRLLHPWRILFRWAEVLWSRVSAGRPPSFGLPVPDWLGCWPAVVLFVIFAWIEMVWDGGERPFSLALAIIAYSLLTWAGMVAFGRETWLRHGEAFALVFGVLARFAPLETRAADAEACRACGAPQCRARPGDCVNCYACAARLEAARPQINLRPHAIGLSRLEPHALSFTVLVVTMLATVTFDGFRETPLWNDAAAWSLSADGFGDLWRGLSLDRLGALAVAQSAGLLGFAVLFNLIYLGFGHLMAGFAGMRPGGPGDQLGTAGRATASRFVLTLVPIALAYHLAHYLSFLLIAGQLVVPLASDPLGLGWNLFNTRHYLIDVSIVNARFVWLLSVATVVVGHVIAVWLAHVVALGAYRDDRAARRSQYPMLVLMVAYTMISLWIMAQPIVASPA